MTDITTLRRYAREWCDFAIGDGRSVDDPVYRAITEGRDAGPGYSSCADLAHWLLFRLGCRESWINRDEHRGWKPIVNVGRLVCAPVGSNPIATRLGHVSELETGDVLVTWRRQDTTDAHVLVFDRLEGSILHSWDFGQGPMAKTAWQGKRHVEGRKRERDLGSFPICSVLSLASVPFTAQTDLPSGERFDALEGIAP